MFKVKAQAAILISPPAGVYPRGPAVTSQWAIRCQRVYAVGRRGINTGAVGETAALIAETSAPFLNGPCQI